MQMDLGGRTLFRLSEIFYTVQGEGYNQGKDALFIRFSGCNLWDGKDNSRETNRTCGAWCDTNFKLNLTFSLEELLDVCKSTADTPTLVVITGGEPALQLTQGLVDNLYRIYPRTLICIETNGTRPINVTKCFVTVAPKENTKLLQTSGNELKVIVPQNLDFKYLDSLSFAHKWFQPKNGLENCNHALDLIQQYPAFRLSLQLHKLIGIR